MQKKLISTFKFILSQFQPFSTFSIRTHSIHLIFPSSCSTFLPQPLTNSLHQLGYVSTAAKKKKTLTNTEEWDWLLSRCSRAKGKKSQLVWPKHGPFIDIPINWVTKRLTVGEKTAFQQWWKSKFQPPFFLHWIYFLKASLREGKLANTRPSRISRGETFGKLSPLVLLHNACITPFSSFSLSLVRTTEVTLPLTPSLLRNSYSHRCVARGRTIICSFFLFVFILTF